MVGVGCFGDDWENATITHNTLLMPTYRIFADLINYPYADAEESDDKATLVPCYITAKTMVIAGWDVTRAL